MKRLLLTGIIAIIAVAQTPKNATIKRDGIVRTTEEHRFELSQCDTIKIELPIDNLNVSNGIVNVYWFKKYAHQQKLVISCEVEK